MHQFEDLRPPIAELEQAVGALVLSWSRLEGSLASLLNIIIESKHSGLGRTLYYATTNLNPRMEIIDHSFLHLTLHSSQYEKSFSNWKKTKEIINKQAAQRRNPIIHGEMVTETDQAAMTVNVSIIPNFGSTVRGEFKPMKPNQRFTLPDIRKATIASGVLFRAVCGISGSVEKASDAVGQLIGLKMTEDALRELVGVKGN